MCVKDVHGQHYDTQSETLGVRMVVPLSAMGWFNMPEPFINLEYVPVVAN